MVHVAVIGAYGSAGVAVADKLLDHANDADIDLRLTLIDGGDPGGGLCILRGCMPSKEVLSAGAHRFQARDDDRLVGGPPAVDLERVVERKDDHTADFAAHRRAAVHRMAESEGVEFLHERARFLDDRRIAVGDRTLEPDYAVVATGSRVNVPDLPGIDDVEYETSADVLDATGYEGETGVVMGFGYVGTELVPYLSEAAGLSLTVVEHDARPLDEADPAYGDALMDLYEGKFDVRILRETREERLEPTDGGVRLHTDRGDEAGTVEADHLFLFTGRRPNLDGLGLENTSLDPGEGRVEDTMQVRDDDRTFVVGDANGREPVLHVAKEEAHLAADNLLRHHRDEALEAHETVHHHVIFTGLGVYPYVRVGHSRESAKAAGIDHVAVTREARDDGVFRTKDAPEGLATLVVDADDGTVLGYQGLHYHADVIAKTAQLAVEMELDVRAIPDRAYHPTTPELLDGLVQEAAAEVGGDGG